LYARAEVEELLEKRMPVGAGILMIGEDFVERRAGRAFRARRVAIVAGVRANLGSIGVLFAFKSNNRVNWSN